MSATSEAASLGQYCEHKNMIAPLPRVHVQAPEPDLRIRTRDCLAIGITANTSLCMATPKPSISQQHVDAFARNVQYGGDILPRVPAHIDKVKQRPLLDRHSEVRALLPPWAACPQESTPSKHYRPTE
jgi:hypothetical protein